MNEMPYVFRFIRIMIVYLRAGERRLRSADEKKKLVALLQLFYDLMVHDKRTIIMDPEEIKEESKRLPNQIDTTGGSSHGAGRGGQEEKQLKKTTKYLYNRASESFKRGVQIYDVFSLS